MVDEQNVAPVPETPKFSIQNPPKTKEEWTKLSKEDPQTWMELTQSRMDMTIRESRETKEKLTAAEQREANLRAEIDRLRQMRENKELPPEEKSEEVTEKEYSFENLPETKEQWEELSVTDPIKFDDLREFARSKERQKKAEQEKFVQDFEKEQEKYRKEVQTIHPDMYQAEVGEDGQPKLDGNGKPVLKINPVTNEPFFAPDSEKGKLWLQIYNEDPQTYSGSKKGPKLLMLEMERRLKEMREKSMGQKEEAQELDQRGTLPEGVPPPRKVKVTFSSDEEKAYAEASVRRGTFKSVEEWYENFHRKDTGIVEKGRVPQFGKP